jgi:hypothetical protein
VSSPTRVLATVDRGTATTAVALIGRAGGRFRLLGSTAGPSGVPAKVLLERVRRRVAAADETLAQLLHIDRTGSAADLPRLTCTTAPPPELAVIAATERVLQPLATVAQMAGWHVRPLVIDGAEILKVATALADRRVDAILAGAAEPPGADERSLIGELGALVAATTERRPDLVAVLAGGLAVPGGRTEALFRADRPGPTVLAPSPTDAEGEPLRALLDSLRGGDDDGRRALAVATGSLATVLRRRIELLEIGQTGGSRVLANWQPGAGAAVHKAAVARAALLPRPFMDQDLDDVIGWLPITLDRLRTRDRLREMATAPWGDAAGDGAVLRMAAVRAAAERLLHATAMFDQLPAPDLVVASGGAWLAGPATAAALAVADIARRPGSRAVGLDHARVLAPIGTMADEEERVRLLADLRDDVLVPLGTVVMAAGLRSSKSVGVVTVHGSDGPVQADLVPGGIDLVDVPPGEHAMVELSFRDPVDVGVRARHLALEVTGGLGGLVVDLRDVPLRLPGRLETRRDLLASWQTAVWPGLDQ